METLVELYDERAIENVLGPETFKPKRVVYLCPKEVMDAKRPQKILKNFFNKRGLNIELDFIEASIYKADKILIQLEKISQIYGKLVLDITGGNDATLFAAGMFCQKTGSSAFTYSRKNNSFYNIINADFADGKRCELSYTVEDFFVMTGGDLRKGRVDNKTLYHHMDSFEPFFKVFLKYRREWNDTIIFFQRISQNHKDEEISLKVSGSLEQKGDHGRRVAGNKNLLKDIEKMGFIRNLNFYKEGMVSFEFKNEEARTWLRDVGAVLELYMYKACVDADIFNDVISSAIVDWEGYVSHDSVSNEIDVVATRGVVPVFISCKACEVKTEALNELAILRDRFGGKGAKAAIVTTEFCNAATRHRAAQLGIAVIDLEELEAGTASERIKVIMKCKQSL